jgi:hypothetical protein
MSTIEKSQQQQTQPNKEETDQLFDDLKESIVEHGGGNYLRLKDGETAVVTVAVHYDPDPEKRQPREEKVMNFDKTKQVWKLRLDCYVDDNTEGPTKIFHVRSQDKAEVLSLLKNGVRRMRISRFGSTATGTKYTFTPLENRLS